MVGATIQSPDASPHDDTTVDNKPCISIISSWIDDNIEVLSRGIGVDVSYLQISDSFRRGVSA